MFRVIFLSIFRHSVRK